MDGAAIVRDSVYGLYTLSHSGYTSSQRLRKPLAITRRASDAAPPAAASYALTVRSKGETLAWVRKHTLCSRA